MYKMASFPQPLEDYEQLIKSMMKTWLPNVPAKILATVYVEPDELSLDEIASRTNYSLATISMAINTLEKIMIIEKIRKPGSKKIFVKVQRDMLGLAEKKIQKAFENEIKPIKEQLPFIIKDFKRVITQQNNKNTKQHYKYHLQLMQDQYDQTIILERLYNNIYEQCRSLRLKQYSSN